MPPPADAQPALYPVRCRFCRKTTEIEWGPLRAGLDNGSIENVEDYTVASGAWGHRPTVNMHVCAACDKGRTRPPEIAQQMALIARLQAEFEAEGLPRRLAISRAVDAEMASYERRFLPDFLDWRGR